MLNELAQIQNKDAQPAQQHQVTLNITLSERLHQAEFQNHYQPARYKASDEFALISNASRTKLETRPVN
jgi:hypothetical protein